MMLCYRSRRPAWRWSPSRRNFRPPQTRRRRRPAQDATFTIFVRAVNVGASRSPWTRQRLDDRSGA